MKKLFAALLVTAMVLTMVGTAFAETDFLEDVEAKEDYKIGIILKTLSNSYWVSMKKGIEEEAQKQGVDVDIYAVSQEGDANEQLRLMENTLRKDYDGMAVAPITPVNLVRGVLKANEEGIPVVNLDEEVDPSALENQGGFVYSFVTTKNVKIGGKAANFVMDNVPAGSKVAIIEGIAGAASGEARKKGFTEGIEANPDYEIVASQPADWDRIKAMNVTNNILRRYPDVKAIYCCNDTMALGAVKALENMGKLDEVVVVGTDGVPEAVESVNAGKLDATIAQDPNMIGVMGLRLVIRALNLPEDVEKDEIAEYMPRNVEIPSQLITQ